MDHQTGDARRHGRLEGHAQPAADRVPDEGEPADGGAQGHRALGRDRPVRPHPRPAPRRPEVHPPRRPALCERPHPSRHGAQQGPQGRHRPLADDGRVRRPVRAGLGLPRPADRAEGGPRAGPAQAPDVGGRLPPRLPGVRRAVCRHHADRLQAARRDGRLGLALPDDELRLPGRDRQGAGPVRRAGDDLQGQEAGALVHPLPDRAGRGRSRVRGPHLAVDLRRVPLHARGGARNRRARARTEGRRQPVGAHLDDDALDDPVQPGDRVPPGVRLRGLPGGRHDGGGRRGAGRERLEAGGPALRPAARALPRAHARGPALPPSAVPSATRSACSPPT